MSVISRPLLNTAHAFNWHQPRGQKRNVDLIEVENIDENFDELWNRRQSEKTRLLACRTSIFLKWHFGNSPFKGTFRILACFDGRLRGYCAVLGQNIPELGIMRLRIADIFAEKDDVSIVNDLLCAAYEYGSDKGYDILEWVGIPESLRKVSLKYQPLARNLPTWPLYYKPMPNKLSDTLQGSDKWYITSFDGDTTLAF